MSRKPMDVCFTAS
uniref:Uncharacterized protein n=1 Tax=Rhizophora mucronata TaxID=61149 RepID=A0A2P2PLH9_RHIMU